MEKIYEDIEAIVILSPSNLFYFTKYSNADAAVLLTKEKKYYICDKRTSEEATEILKDFEIVNVETYSLNYVLTARKLIKNLGIKVVGYEDKQILHSRFLELAGSPFARGFKLKGAEDYINSLRAVKREDEIEIIKQAQEITDKVFEETLTFIKRGMTELEVAAFMNSRIFSYGAELAFPPIVAFGKNTSKPHAHPSENKLQENDVVTLDFGAKYMGYCSDMTRSFVVGKAPEGYVEVYNTVLKAQEYAIQNLKADISGKDGDLLARDVIHNAGYKGLFTHSLGHSLGVDIHESPNLSPNFKGNIPCGAVLSVEPGIYLEGKFGVRIEDIVVFQKSRVDNLTKSRKQLIILE